MLFLNIKKIYIKGEKMSKKIPIINQIIKDKRKELKITQEEFTKIINKSIATVRRYDTGDLIPNDTIFLICGKLMLDILELIRKQDLENKTLNTKYYEDFIKKAGWGFLFYNKKQEESEHKEIKNNLEKIFNMFFPTYDNSIIIEEEYRNESIGIKAEMHIFKIIDSRENKVLFILNFEEATSIFKDMKEYFDFKFEKIKKERLRRDTKKEIRDIIKNNY